MVKIKDLKPNLFFLVYILLISINTRVNAFEWRGKLVDANEESIPYANIIILENRQGTITDIEGNFHFELPKGRYTILITHIGYESFQERINWTTDTTLNKTYRLVDKTIQIGGIMVTAPDRFIPPDGQTKTSISSGEIEHIQATSLSDILLLQPGQAPRNPTMSAPEKATIRGGQSLGAQLLLDGVELSNTANMQVGIGYSSANTGYDLRAIPAENIESVEIIRGVPSARYGNLADGAVKVTTKNRNEPLRIKFKYNPHLYESNISLGRIFNQWTISTNANIALSERDIRIPGDGYTRLAWQISARRETVTRKWFHSILITRSFDESKEKPELVDRAAWYNRDLMARYSHTHELRLTSQFKLSNSFALTWTHQNSFSQGIVARDNTIVSDRITEGSQEGVIVFGSYLGKKQIKGEVFNFAVHLSNEWQQPNWFWHHTIISGIDYQLDANYGKGVLFDPLYPPTVGLQSARPRSYDHLPAYHQVAFYVEDKINGRLGLPFTLQIGIRYDAFRPEKWNGLRGLTASQGAFLQPRSNLSISLSEQSQLRFGFGQTAKSPPLGLIYPGNKYIDMSDTVAVVDPAHPDKNFSIITTNIFNQDTPHLKAYRENKWEMSWDQELGPTGFTLTAFLAQTFDEFRSLTTPVVIHKRSFPDWPDQSTAFVKDTVFLYDYSSYFNDGEKTSRGLEFTFRTRRLPRIHTIFRVDAAYSYYYYQNNLNYYSSFPINLSLENQPVRALYKSNPPYSHNLQIDYRCDIQFARLGIWVTLHAMQDILSISGYKNMTDIYPKGYLTQDGRLVAIPPEDQTSDEYQMLRESLQPYELNEEDMPNLWLFNINVSKSLWKGAELSFFVNNLFNHRPYYMQKRSSPKNPVYTRRNPELFYGLQLSAQINP